MQMLLYVTWGVRITAYRKLEQTEEEVAMAYFSVLFQHSPWGHWTIMAKLKINKTKTTKFNMNII
jgi:hypothetical protein